VEKGQQIFQLNCTSCHGGDPQKDGPIGPSVAGSTLPLIEARVRRAEYPVGYKPKRTTKTMVALPHLKDDLPAIHAYLNSFPPPAAPTP
jgi:mono/diheme cytochrome c family protein